MKFAEHLQAHITPEWRKQYIQYEDMKSMLYNAVEQSPSAEIEDTDVTTRYFAKFDEKFFHFADKELTKINTFFSEKLAEATRRSATLKSEMTASKDASLETSDMRKRKAIQNKLRGRTSARKLQDMKLAFSEFYLSLILLQNYQNLNFTGFRKILKKHDKLLATEEGAAWRIEHVEVAAFATNKDIDKLIAETEAMVTNELEGGDRQKAMKRLRVPPLGEQQNPLTTFKVGLFSGAFIVLLTAVLISAVAHRGLDDWRIVFRLYRGLFLVILFIFLLGINIYGWRSSGVNHVLIFELDPRNHLSEQHLMEMAAVFGVLWCLSVLSFLYSGALGIPPYINPLVLVILMAVFLLNPTRTFRHGARFWFLRVLGRIVCAPFFFVGFADFWIADQLNSLVPAILDFEYLICFYATSSGWAVAQDTGKCVDKTWIVRPIIACLPAWFRFAQCLRRYRDLREANPHLLNAAKYATTFTVVIFSTLNIKFKDNYLEDMNPFFYLWIVALVVSSCYAYMWDIRMDWGLFDPDAGENTFLREEIVYSSPGYYYFGIVEDFVLRFGWTLSISLTEMGYIHGDLMLTVLAPLEVFRRFVWNFFRLENEHLNNCGKFRAVRDISVAPIHDSDQAIMLRMMDEDDGVVNRKKKKGGKKKTETQKLIGEESADHDPYATVTSISSVKNWFANITSKMGNVD